jgi:hypothetical protein
MKSLPGPIIRYTIPMTIATPRITGSVLRIKLDNTFRKPFPSFPVSIWLVLILPKPPKRCRSSRRSLRKDVPPSSVGDISVGNGVVTSKISGEGFGGERRALGRGLTGGVSGIKIWSRMSETKSEDDSWMKGGILGVGLTERFLSQNWQISVPTSIHSAQKGHFCMSANQSGGSTSRLQWRQNIASS